MISIHVVSYFLLILSTLYYFYTWYLFSHFPFLFLYVFTLLPWTSSLYIFYTTAVHGIFPSSSSEFHMFYQFCGWNLLQRLLNSVNVLYYSFAWTLIFSLLHSVWVSCYFCASFLLYFLFSNLYEIYVISMHSLLSLLNSVGGGGVILFQCISLIFPINCDLYYLCTCVVFPLLILCVLRSFCA
jgi:hypothetical protein